MIRFTSPFVTRLRQHDKKNPVIEAYVTVFFVATAFASDKRTNRPIVSYDDGKTWPCNDGDNPTGVNFVKRALEEPLRQLAQNAGHESAAVVGHVRESKDENFGFNSETGEFGDLVKADVIDPAKVTGLALQNAASIVSLVLTTELLIAYAKGERKWSPQAEAWVVRTKMVLGSRSNRN